MSYSAYNWILVGLLLCLSVASLMLMFTIQPFEGDMTRMGGWAEATHGWNEPQYRPRGETRVRYLDDPEQIDRQYDLIVVGDSFSQESSLGRVAWQSYLSARTDLEIATFYRYRWSVEEIVASEPFRRHPPRVLLLEFGELSVNWPAIPGRKVILAPEVAPVDCEPQAGSSIPSIPLLLREPSLEPFRRRAGVASASEAVVWLRERAFAQNRVRRSRLESRRLFSSRKSDVLLTYVHQPGMFELTVENVRRYGCRLLQLQQRVEQNGTTRLLVMPVPDKLSAYCPYIADGDVACDSIIEQLALPGLRMLRLDRRIDAALRAGTVDLYLPNDTHWGYRGSELASQAVIDALTGGAAAATPN